MQSAKKLHHLTIHEAHGLLEERKLSPVELTQAFLDRIEAHCLQAQFRYDHLHREGDLVIWDDYALLHSAPPVKIGINRLESE